MKKRTWLLAGMAVAFLLEIAFHVWLYISENWEWLHLGRTAIVVGLFFMLEWRFRQDGVRAGKSRYFNGASDVKCWNGSWIGETEPSRKRKITLMFIDLDRFQTINDTAGHHIGDLLLVEVTKRLKQLFGNQALIARYGGDEFSVTLPMSAGTMQNASPPNCCTNFPSLTKFMARNIR